MVSSSGGFYAVVCRFDGDTIYSLTCECMGAQCNEFCKHVKGFFATDPALLLDGHDMSLTHTQSFYAICERIKISPLGAMHDKLLADLAAIEVNQKALKTAARNLKANFVRELKEKV